MMQLWLTMSVCSTVHSVLGPSRCGGLPTRTGVASSAVQRSAPMNIQNSAIYFRLAIPANATKSTGVLSLIRSWQDLFTSKPCHRGCKKALGLLHRPYITRRLPTYPARRHWFAQLTCLFQCGEKLFETLVKVRPRSYKRPAPGSWVAVNFIDSKPCRCKHDQFRILP